MDKKLEKVNLSLMEIFMKVISQMDNSMVKESILSQDLVKFMKVNLQKIIFKDKVKWYGLMEQYMKVDSLTENKKDMEKRNGQMEATTKALGCKI